MLATLEVYWHYICIFLGVIGVIGSFKNWSFVTSIRYGDIFDIQDGSMRARYISGFIGLFFIVVSLLDIFRDWN